jgi:hypothetical protein
MTQVSSGRLNEPDSNCSHCGRICQDVKRSNGVLNGRNGVETHLLQHLWKPGKIGRAEFKTVRFSWWLTLCENPVLLYSARHKILLLFWSVLPSLFCFALRCAVFNDVKLVPMVTAVNNMSDSDRAGYKVIYQNAQESDNIYQIRSRMRTYTHKNTCEQREFSCITL